MPQVLTGVRAKPRKTRPTAKLQNTTVRDFGGGLNVVDSEHNLTARFSPVFDNMVTYTDKRCGPRYGYEMWLKTKQGTEVTGIATPVRFKTTAESRWVTLEWTAHPFNISSPVKELQHITIRDIITTIGGIPPDDINGTHGIVVVDVDNIKFAVRTPATSAVNALGDLHCSYDTHMCGGSPIEAFYFSNRLVVWTSCGEIFTIDSNKGMTRIFSAAIMNAREAPQAPWSTSEIIAKDVFGSELVCCNAKDKPLSIDFQRETDDVIYLVDPATGDTYMPIFDACKSAFRYFTVHDTKTDPFDALNTHVTDIRIAAKDTCVLFTGPEDSGDAVDVNMSKIIASTELTIRGFATIKDALLVIMPNATVMMKYGFYDSLDLHDPAPNDMLVGFGTSAMRSIVEIGSDVFMVDYNGVPSARLSTISNSVVPERVSQYIETAISRHIGRLTKETTRLHLFGLFDTKNRLIHFYLPKYDATDKRLLNDDPFYFDSDIAKNAQAQLIMRHDKHQLEVGDTIRITGATGFSTLAPADINGDRVIGGILNEDYLLINIDHDLPDNVDAGGGGNSVHIQPLNLETIGYVYHFVPALKMYSWSRFRTNMLFTCGCATIQGRTFLFDKDGHAFRYGAHDGPVYGDWYGMYDFITWEKDRTYTPGQRVFDSHDGLVYKCLAETVGTAYGNFQDAREADPDAWEQYRGEPIKFAWELPWADFGTRQITKSLRFTHVDALGSAQFKMALFADNIYKDASTGTLIPARELTFVPNDAYAYGAGMQVYGGGRRTREQRLWQMPMRFKLLKVRITGESVDPMSFSALSFLYQRGSATRG